MDAETVEKIADLGGKAKQPTFATCSCEPKHVYYLNIPGGTPVKVVAEPEPPAHTALSMDALVKATLGHPAPGKRSVWVNNNSVVGLVDAVTRRGRATLALPFSKQLVTIQGWEASTPSFDQKGLTTALRTLFKEQHHPGNLAELVKKLNWQIIQKGESELSFGGASVSKSMMAEVAGASTIPQYVTFDVPVYENPDLNYRAKVEVALDLDPHNQRFLFLPLPGKVTAAIAAAQNAILAHARSLLDASGAKDVPVYAGTP